MPGALIPEWFVDQLPGRVEMNVASIIWGVSIAAGMFTASKGAKQAGLIMDFTLAAADACHPCRGNEGRVLHHPVLLGVLEPVTIDVDACRHGVGQKTHRQSRVY